jgi:hypothetical protein
MKWTTSLINHESCSSFGNHFMNVWDYVLFRTQLCILFCMPGSLPLFPTLFVQYLYFYYNYNSLKFMNVCSVKGNKQECSFIICFRYAFNHFLKYHLHLIKDTGRYCKHRGSLEWSRKTCCIYVTEVTLYFTNCLLIVCIILWSTKLKRERSRCSRPSLF